MEVSVLRDTDTGVTDSIGVQTVGLSLFQMLSNMLLEDLQALAERGPLALRVEAGFQALVTAERGPIAEAIGAQMVSYDTLDTELLRNSHAKATAQTGLIALQAEARVTDSIGVLTVCLPSYETPLMKLLRYSQAKATAQRGLIALQAEARRGILSKFLDSFAVDKEFKEIYSRVEEDDWLEDDIVSRIRECFDEIEKTFAPVASDLRKAYAVVVAAVVLLCYVYQYLTGCVDWDGSKAESSGSLDYRDTYISIVLFQGAYVWIKFRDVAFTKPVPTGAVLTVVTQCKDGRTKVKYEPRFKPHNENGISINRIYSGQFESYADAEFAYRVAASCYEYGECYGTTLDLGGDGPELFTIVPEFTPEERALSGVEKVAWVKERVKTVYKSYKTRKDPRNLAPTLPGASLEQELQIDRLQLEVLSERQQKEDLARQLHQYQDLQQEWQVQFQNLHVRFENLQRQVQDLQQARYCQVPNLQPQLQVQDLRQAQHCQVPNLQPQLQVQDLQQQQPEAEWLSEDEVFMQPIPEEDEFGAL